MTTNHMKEGVELTPETSGVLNIARTENNVQHDRCNALNFKIRPYACLLSPN